VQSDTEPGGQAGGDAELEVPTRGDENAPVTMVEYADFQCSFCGKFARDVEPELIERYVESGTLKIEWRDFPYLGQESVNAALAARAAQEQGKFWEYHDALYRNQGSVNSGTFSNENLVALAEEAGLDAESFESDLTSGKYERAISQDLQEGQRLGISGTPTFFINDRALVGAQPIEAFEEAIEEAAREAGNG
jgi:protein-disulfide isomerase